MKQKYIIFLGLSINQIPFLQSAKRNQFRIIGVDKNSKALGRPFCDIFLNEGINEKHIIYNNFKHLNVKGALSEQTDNGSHTVAYLNEKFQLKGLTHKQINIICDKLKQRRFLNTLGVNQPRYWTIKTIPDVQKKLLAKPRCGQSSIGIHFLQKNEILNSDYLYEEYIQGKDFSVDGLVSNGYFYLAWCEKIKYADSFVDKISLASSSVPRAVKNMCGKILDAIDANDVFFHFEFRLSRGKYFLMEMHLRGGGSGLCTFIASYINDIDTANIRIQMLYKTCLIPKISNIEYKRACTVFGGKREMHNLRNLLMKRFPSAKISFNNLNKRNIDKIIDCRDRESCLYICYDERISDQLSNFLIKNVDFRI